MAERIILSNKKAFHDFHIEDRLEVGIALTGTEVKSLRVGKGNLKDSYARVVGGEMFLYNMHISPYSHALTRDQEPLRVRKLLLHKAEIRRLTGKTQERGYTLVPLRVYFSDSHVKVELGLGKGKKLFDKRQATAERDQKRDIDRALRERQKPDRSR